MMAGAANSKAVADVPFRTVLRSMVIRPFLIPQIIDLSSYLFSSCSQRRHRHRWFIAVVLLIDRAIERWPYSPTVP